MGLLYPLPYTAKSTDTNQIMQMQRMLLTKNTTLNTLLCTVQYVDNLG